MITKGKGVIRATIVGSVIVLVAWQLIAIIVTLVANGNAFNKEQQIDGINPVANWYNVANRCANIAEQNASENRRNLGDSARDEIKRLFNN